MDLDQLREQADAARKAIADLKATGDTITVAELSDRWGISPQRVRKMAKDDDTFPSPLHREVGLYARALVDAWRAERAAHPSRPGPKPNLRATEQAEALAKAHAKAMGAEPDARQ